MAIKLITENLLNREKNVLFTRLYVYIVDI